jgi:response regulator RpfG family c-di-GMP phosphodiesterase
MPQLRIKTGPNRDQTFPVTEKLISIGRDPTCTIQLYDTAASRNHAEVFQIGEMCFVRDLGSRNCTYVNEEKIEEELLRAGDKIRIGSTVLAFEDEQAAKAEEAEGQVPNVEFREDDKDEGAAKPAEAAFEASIDLGAGKPEKGTVSPAGADREVATHLGLLLELSRAISAERHLKPLADKVLEIAAKGIQARIGIVFLRDVRSGQLNPRAHFGIAPGEQVKVSRTIVRHVFEKGKAVLTSDAVEDDRFKAAESVVLQGIHSVISVPLVSHDKPMGVLYFESEGVEKPFKPEDLDLVTAIGLQASVAMENVLAHAQQRRILVGAIRTLVTIVEMQNPKVQGHSERVCTCAAAIGEQMKLSEAENHNVQLAALLHDIGKVGSDEAAKADESAQRVEAHVNRGLKLLENMFGMEDVLPGIKFHHETMDGNGPEGVPGDKIPLTAKIVAVANKFDHLMTSGGEDGMGLPTKEALLEMSKLGGQTLDSEVVAALFVAHRSGKLFSPKTIFDQATSKGDK